MGVLRIFLKILKNNLKRNRNYTFKFIGNSVVLLYFKNYIICIKIL